MDLRHHYVAFPLLSGLLATPDPLAVERNDQELGRKVEE